MVYFFSLILAIVVIVVFLLLAVAGLAIGQIIWSGLSVALVYKLKPRGKRGACNIMRD